MLYINLYKLFEMPFLHSGPLQKHQHRYTYVFFSYTHTRVVDLAVHICRPKLVQETFCRIPIFPDGVLEHLTGRRYPIILLSQLPCLKRQTSRITIRIYQFRNFLILQ